MNKKKIKLIESFKAINETGKVFTIYVNQEFNIAEEFMAEPQEIPGIMSLRTSDGKHVNKIDENTYEILGNTEIIRLKRM
jgi:hypothetical protein